MDNDASKWGGVIDGIPIMAPVVLQEKDASTYKVIICIKNYTGVLKQVKELGATNIGIYDTNTEYPRRQKEAVVSGILGEEKKKYHIGYVAGAFDLFHIGHLNLLRRAKEQCDYLIVGVVTDEGIRVHNLNENGTQQEFEQFRQSIHRLEKIVTEDVKFLFNRKDSFLFFTLFDTFTKLGMEDLRFVEFLRVFQSELRFSKKNERGLLFDEIDKDLNTKDKQVIFDKLEMLKAVMLDFFQISDGKIITAEELVREWVDCSVTEEDMELYEIVANDISEAVHDIDSVFLSDRNRPSFVALAAYAVRQDTEGMMKQWLTGFEREGRLLWNQRDNYFYMKKEFDKFVLDKTNKCSYNGISKTEQMFDDHIGGYVL